MIRAAGAAVSLLYLFAVIGVFVDRKLAARGVGSQQTDNEASDGEST